MTTVKQPLYPDFIIGGAQKCATSSMAIWLDSHPDMVCSTPKEPDFFSNKQKVQEGIDYSVCFPKECSLSNNVKLFEASTGYFTDPQAAYYIKATLGDGVKLLFIIRDPVDRTISAYYHMLKHHAERRSPEEVFGNLPENRNDIRAYEDAALEKAKQQGRIDNKRQKRYDDHFLQFRYVSNSFYTTHYKIYEDIFGSENILLLNLDSINKDPKAFFKRITDFVGAAEFSVFPNIEKSYNKTKVAFYLLSPIIRNNHILFSLFNGVHHVSAKLGMSSFFMMEAPEFPENLKKMLEKLFAEEYELLAIMP